MRQLQVLFFSVLILGAAAPVAAWTTTSGGSSSLNDSQEPGSVLVFHRFQTGTVTTADQGVQPRTQFELSVVCPKGGTCPNMTPVTLKAHWVCKGVEEGNNKGFCAETDFELHTTVNGTLVFNPAGVQPTNVLTPTVKGSPAVPVPPVDCEEGYLIVWVTDTSGNPIAFDALIGHAVVREFNNEVHAYNAIPIQAAGGLGEGPGIDAGAQIGVAGGPLLFDGTMYQAITGKIFGTVRYSGTNSTVRTDLIFLTLDLNSNRVNDLTSVDLKFFNENEVPHSTSISFYCWKEFDPRELDPSLTSDNPSWGLRGLVKSNAAVQGGNPSTLLGMVETREGPFIESVEIPDVPVTICQYLPVLGFTCLTEVETVTAQFPLVRQYSYLLYNDSEPVATTFYPND